MSRLILPSRFTTQPQYPAPVDWSNPITLGLVRAYSPTCPDFDLVAKAPITYTANARKFGVGKSGVCLVADTAGSSMSMPLWTNTTGEASLVILQKRNSTADNTWLELGTGQQDHFGYGEGIYTDAFLDNVRWLSGNSISSYPYTSDHTVVITADGNSKNLYIGTSLVGTNTSPGYPISIPSSGQFSGFAGSSFSADMNTYLILLFDRFLTDAQRLGLTENPWQIFKAPPKPLFFSAGGGTNATATGALPSITLAAVTGTATGSATTSAALPSITLSAATGTASAGTSATATGSVASITVAAPTSAATGSASTSTTPSAITVTPTTAAASGSASGTGALPAVTLAAITGAATGTATATSALAAISLTAITGTASGTTAGNAIGTGTPASVSIAAPTGSATGSAATSGSLAAVSLTAPTGSASGTAAGDAVAIAAFAALSINPATGAAYASSVATGSLPVISLTAPVGSASSVAYTRAPDGPGPKLLSPVRAKIRLIEPTTIRPPNVGGSRS